MTVKRFSPSRGKVNVQSAVGQQSASLGKSPTTGQLIFNVVLAVLGLFAAAIMFSFGISLANHGSILAGIGLIFAGLFVFWRGGSRVSWICAEFKMRRQK